VHNKEFHEIERFVHWRTIWNTYIILHWNDVIILFTLSVIESTNAKMGQMQKSGLISPIAIGYVDTDVKKNVFIYRLKCHFKFYIYIYIYIYIYNFNYYYFI